MFNPVPVVAVDGLPRCTALTGEDGRPAFAPGIATLTGEMRIRWGRADPWSTVQPTTLDVELFDPTGEWLNRIVTRDAIGRPVQITWDIPESVPDDDDLPDRVWRPFAGFITAVEIEADRQRTTAGWRDGWRVAITAADRRVALGNVIVAWDPWGAERMIDRAVRLRNLAASAGIREFYYENRFRESPVSPAEIKDQTANELFGALYESFGQQWTYNPHRNVCIRIPRHRSNSQLFLTKVDPGPYIALVGQELTDPTGQETPQDQAPHRPAALDAADVTGGISLHTDQTDDLNRWEVTWDVAPAFDRHTSIMTPTGTDDPPYRVLSFDSWLSDGLDVDPVLNEVALSAQDEARGPHHPPVSFSTARTGGFRNVAQAMALTLPSEQGRVVTLTGSPWTAVLGRPPIHAPTGGEITYSDGHWDITVDLTTHLSIAVDPANAVTWDDLVEYASWGDTGHSGWRLSRALSWHDMRYLADGNIYTDWS